jgi:hypothetical protein
MIAKPEAAVNCLCSLALRESRAHFVMIQPEMERGRCPLVRVPGEPCDNYHLLKGNIVRADCISSRGDGKDHKHKNAEISNKFR